MARAVSRWPAVFFWCQEALFALRGAAADYHGLHLRLLSPGIEFCIERGIARFEPAPRRAQVSRASSLRSPGRRIYIRRCRLHHADGAYLEREGESVDE